MFSRSDTNLSLPLSVKPTCIASSCQNNTRGLEIPLWAKSSFPNNLGDYVAIVPLHHAIATKYLAAQREQAAAQQKAVTEAFRDGSSTDSTWSMTDDISDENSHKGAGHDNISDDESSGVDECIAPASSCAVEDIADSMASSPELSRTEALVASLRDARQLAHARRVALDADFDCAFKEDVVDDAAGYIQTELVAVLRAAREKAASRRLALPASSAMVSATTTASFSVRIITVDGAVHEVSSLHSHMLVSELVELVAATFEIPNFAVRLLWDAQILHMSQPATPLSMVGIQEGSELTLVKNFGWGKPDVTQLHEIERL